MVDNDDGNGNGVPLVDEKRAELARLQDQLRECDEGLKVARDEVLVRQQAISTAAQAQDAAVLEKWVELEGDTPTKVMDRVYTLGAFGNDQRLRDSLSKAESSVKVLCDRRHQLVVQINAVQKAIHHLELRERIERAQGALQAFVKTARSLGLRYRDLCEAVRVMQEKDGQWNKTASEMGAKDPFFHVVAGTFLNLAKLGARGGVALATFMDQITALPNTPFERDVAHWRLDRIAQPPAWHDRSEYGISQRRSA